MNEGLYRLFKIVLLAILVAGSLSIGSRIAENGRYVQYDRQKDFRVMEGSSDGSCTGSTMMMDTRTGRMVDAVHGEEDTKQ